jgi:integrase
MDYREECGECVTKDSWVMRNLWDATKPREKDVITKPRKLTSIGIKRLVERALWAQGVRNTLQKGKKRHEFQTDHGFRKWFRTRCELAGMKLSNIETLMNHSLGISDPIIVSQKANFLRIIREQKISYLLTTSKNYRKRLQT